MPGPVRTNRVHPQGLTPADVFSQVQTLQQSEQAAGSAQHARTDHSNEPSYYNVSILKPPVWKWEIAGYFFLGGLSAGAYTLARFAERFGGRRFGSLTRTATTISFASSLPCAPLLIKDLGDPVRFHHMLRVWKPTSPMNLGTWTLTSYTGMVTAALLREIVRSKFGWGRGRRSRRADRSLMVLHDAAGLPLAVLVLGYSGVLLSSTSNPLWCKNRWIGPMFSASAVATGAEAVSLALHATGERSRPMHQSLECISTAAHIGEAASLAGYLKQSGEKAKPLTRGSMRHHLWISVIGLVGAELLKLLPVPERYKRWMQIAAAVLGLAAGFSLRWGMVYGGQEAAGDPHLARLTTRNDDEQSRQVTNRAAGWRQSLRHMLRSKGRS